MKLDYFTAKYGAEFISSRSNNTIVSFSKLADKKYRDENRLFLSEGTKLVEEALLNTEAVCVIICETAVKKEKNEILSLADSAHAKGIRIIAVSEPAFEKLSSEKSPQGIISVSKYPQNYSADNFSFDLWQNGKRIVVLDNIQDPGNLGTIVRSAAAMGFYGIITVNCADMYSSKALRASMGALFRCSVYSFESSFDMVGAVKILKNNGRRVLAAALGEVSYTLGEHEPEIKESDCIIIGNEGHGIDKELLSECSAALKIPMTDGSESLNAAAAAAIILWEYHRKFDL